MASVTRRVAIITGAAQGIGRAIALRLAKDGLDLGLFDLPACKNLQEELAASIRTDFGSRVVTVYGDVSVEEDVKALVDTVVQELGDLYVVCYTPDHSSRPRYSPPAQMIANAGISAVYPLHESTFERIVSIRCCTDTRSRALQLRPR